jgi:predicted nucleotidyltransferase
MALLKIIAWTDRATDLRAKDAKDVLHLIRNYQKIPEVLDAVYDDTELGERRAWDVELMSAEIFGRRTGAIASPETSRAVVALADDADAIDSLAWEMSDGVERVLERSRTLLTVFFDGFRACL